MSKKSITEAAKKQAQKNFNPNDIRELLGLEPMQPPKEQQWLPLSDGFQQALSLPGIPLGRITLLRGHSDTGKTTALYEAAISAQKRDILPVFISTEAKEDFSHAKLMGLETELRVDEETGEMFPSFLKYTLNDFNSIEGIAKLINDTIDLQEKGKIPFDLLFLWDSIGSVPCELNLTSKTFNNEWNAGAMERVFSKGVNNRINNSMDKSSKFTNTLVCVNKVWTSKPDNPMGQPRMENKGGNAMWYDASLIVTFGNIKNSGSSKIKAINKGKQVIFASRVNVVVEKNHQTGVSTRSKIITTPHGLIPDSESALKKYKKDSMDFWAEILGGAEFKLVATDTPETGSEQFTQEP